MHDEGWGDQMQLSRETINTAGSWATIIAALVGGVWFLAGLDSRVRRLEEQVHVITVAPTIAAAGAAARTPIGNPLADACAELARRAVTGAGPAGSTGEQLEAEKMLEQLGCVKRPSGR